MSAEEYRKELKKSGWLDRIAVVYQLNTGDFMASTDPDPNDKVAKMAREKYGAVDVTDLVLGR